MPQTSGKPDTRDPTTNLEDKPNGSQSVVMDRGEKEKLKRERKREKKDRDRTEKDSVKDTAEGEQASISGKDTPVSPVSDSTPKSTAGRVEDVPSPVENNGTRTPTSRKSSRNPWTLFMKTEVSANETEIRGFFGKYRDKVGSTIRIVLAILKYQQIIRVNYPQNQHGKAQKIAYVEFEDENTMKAALEGHAEVGVCLVNW